MITTEKTLNNIFIAIMIILTACAGNQGHVENGNGLSESGKDTLPEKQPMTGSQPPRPVIIYKTKKDYSRNVPVIMDHKKEIITSYPAPGDITFKGKLPYPTPLKDGFLLDNRGINERVAYLDITYEAYSKIDSTPPVSAIDSMIIDKDPLEVMFFCGSEGQYKNLVEELNQAIEQKEFEIWRRMK